MLVDADAVIRNSSRVLTALALASFLGWIASVDPWFLLASLVLGAAAYAFFLEDRHRNPVPIGVGVGSDAEDRVGAGSEESISPGVSVGGIHLSFESRSRWRTRR